MLYQAAIYKEARQDALTLPVGAVLFFLAFDLCHGAAGITCRRGALQEAHF